MTVILASQSPRRRQLLGQMGFTDFKICPARGEEVAAPGLTPAQLDASVRGESYSKEYFVMIPQNVPQGSGPAGRFCGFDSVSAPAHMVNWMAQNAA